MPRYSNCRTVKLEAKLKSLKDILSKMESMLLAYSGGVDSTFLLKVAKDVLKDKVVAVTATSPTYARREIKQAERNARRLRVQQLIIKTDELDNPHFAANPPERCYFCKQELFAQLLKLAKRYNLNYVADAAHLDDVNDFRPGIKAAMELGIRSPLKKAGFTKHDIRMLSKKMKLSTWNKPPCPCLASRFPYGARITKKELLRVERAEELLAKLSIKQFRVRVHGNLVRIEVLKKDIPRLVQRGNSEKIIKKLKSLGYLYITLDLQGYRMGSMNEPLKNNTD